MAVTPQDLAAVQDTVVKIIVRAKALLAPLEHEMKVMAWAPEYRAIMWESVMLEAAERKVAAEKETGQ